MVERNLKRLGYSTLFLHYRRTITHARRVKEVIRSYFPRYLFVGVPQGYGLYDINTSPGVSTVLHCDGEPLKVDGALISDLRGYADETGLVAGVAEQKERRDRFAKGQRLRVNQGPMTGLEGIVEVDKGGEIILLLEMFKQRVRASVFPEAVSPVVQRLPA